MIPSSLSSGSTSGQAEWPDIVQGMVLGGSGPQAFVVEGLIGRGACGEVYRVRHAVTGAPYALKTLRREMQGESQMVEHFVHEGRLWTRLTPEANIVTAHGYLTFNEAGDRPFLQIAFVPGHSLRDVMTAEGGRLTPIQAVNCAVGVCQGLRDVRDVEHMDQPLVHRDISPDNILIQGGGGRNVTKLTDFGLADYAAAARCPEPCGKWLFMAPEVVKGGGWDSRSAAGSVDHRADIYSLGVTLYLCLTGAYPIVARRTAAEMAEAILSAEPLPVDQILPGPVVSSAPRLAATVMQCLAKNPADRPQSWEVLHAALMEAAPLLTSVWTGLECQGCGFKSIRARIGACPVCGGAMDKPSVKKPIAPTAPRIEAPIVGQPMTFVRIPAGPYISGCNKTFLVDFSRSMRQRGQQIDLAKLAEPKAAKRNLPTFEIARTPVTIGQFREFISKTGYSCTGSPELEGHPDLPIAHIGSADAMAYCDWVGGRLPMVEEWEKAARGLDGRPYPWGSAFSAEHCVCSESGSTGPAPVGQRPGNVSPFGLMDCVGNVGEMVDAGRSGKLIVMGGSYEEDCELYGLLWNHNILVNPQDGHPSAGFRVVKPADMRAAMPEWAQRFVPVSGEGCVGCDESLVDLIACQLAIADDLRASFVSNPLRFVHLPVFDMNRYPVTNEDYWEFVSSTGHRRPSHWRQDVLAWSTRPFLAFDRWRPVVNVSVEDARAFCAWKTQKDGMGYSLPTREQWEVAARGRDGRIYPWGSVFDQSVCNDCGSPWQRTVDVRDYPEGDSPAGCRQMAGNVYEWVEGETEGTWSKSGGSYTGDVEAYGLVFFRVQTNIEMDAQTGFRVIRQHVEGVRP